MVKPLAYINTTSWKKYTYIIMISVLIVFHSEIIPLLWLLITSLLSKVTWDSLYALKRKLHIVYNQRQKSHHLYLHFSPSVTGFSPELSSFLPISSISFFFFFIREYGFSPRHFFVLKKLYMILPEFFFLSI